ncbi:MAG: MAPEG family protein [Nitratireductor sp.]|nr:MAPEG family protein [Nitratireductor sp.]
MEHGAILPGTSTEMGYLILGTVLLFIHVSVQSFALKAQAGNLYTIGSRDEEILPTGMAARARRALENYLETFPALVALALAVEVTGKADWWTGLGAAIWFWARVAYLPAYLSGLPWVRTFIWNASMIGLVVIIVRLVVS